MLFNYLKVAVRNILRYKFYAFINIFGLTVGIAASLFVLIYVYDELSYDKFHHDYEDIYALKLIGRVAGQDFLTSNTSPPIAPDAMAEIPGIEGYARLRPYYGTPVIRYEDKMFAESQIFFTDSSVFDFFDFKLLKGDPVNALTEPNTIVLNEDLAAKYFGEEDPVGKLMTIGNDNTTYKVTGVVENAPSNSSIQFNGLASWTTLSEENTTNWMNNGMYTYFRIPNADLDDFNASMRELTIKNIGPMLEQFMGVNYSQFEEQGGLYGYYAYPFENTHLYEELDDLMVPNSSISYVYIFSAIGIFILIIACINFMNLSTARSSGRAKEVGLRKTLGSLRRQMIGQFLIESIIYSFVATLMAVIIVYLLLPSFNTLSGKELTTEILFSSFTIWTTLGVALFVGLIAGSYPAFYLTSFSAAEVLKGKVRAGMKSGWVRSVLVVFQFAISIALIAGTVVVYNQLNFMQNKNLGLDKENVLIVSNTRGLGNELGAFKNSISAFTNINSASYTTSVFPGVNNSSAFRPDGSDQDYILGNFSADYDFLDVMKFELVEGRFLSQDFPSDSNATVVNEATVEHLEWEDPIGKKIFDFNREQMLEVVGVVKDYNFESLKSRIRPIIVKLANGGNNMVVRYEGDPREAITNLEGEWSKILPSEPFDYRFLDENYDELFRAEQRLSKLISVLSVIAIFIATLGLLGLSAYTAEQRTKEIGIRKVMGASTFTLTTLMSREFTKLVIIAFVLAAVPSWYFANGWLEEFAYRVEMNPLTIVIAGVSALLVAWATVSYQAVKAAMSDPVKALRYE